MSSTSSAVIETANLLSVESPEGYIPVMEDPQFSDIIEAAKNAVEQQQSQDTVKPPTNEELSDTAQLKYVDQLLEYTTRQSVKIKDIAIEFDRDNDQNVIPVKGEAFKQWYPFVMSILNRAFKYDELEDELKPATYAMMEGKTAILLGYYGTKRVSGATVIDPRTGNVTAMKREWSKVFSADKITVEKAGKTPKNEASWGGGTVALNGSHLEDQGFKQGFKVFYNKPTSIQQLIDWLESNKDKNLNLLLIHQDNDNLVEGAFKKDKEDNK